MRQFGGRPSNRDKSRTSPQACQLAGLVKDGMGVCFQGSPQEIRRWTPISSHLTAEPRASGVNFWGSCPEITSRKEAEAPFLPCFFAPVSVGAAQQRLRGRASVDLLQSAGSTRQQQNLQAHP